MAKLGVGILIIPQKPWEKVAKELNVYRQAYEQVNGAPAPAPIGVGWTFCDESADRAYEMARKYIGGYWATVLEHYEMKADHFKSIKGYEYYAKMTDKLFKYGDDEVMEFFMNLQVWGTPEQCHEKIMKIHDTIGNDTFVGVFSYAGMPYDEAERNLRLFADKVMPGLKAFQPKAEPAWAVPRTA
jgi:alkanesulfonate monooxygenase SsuD/methylene tetrahydromethanopterin reductase-like flavin-dependent oxidoreductase (luciferase family)